MAERELEVVNIDPEDIEELEVVNIAPSDIEELEVVDVDPSGIEEDVPWYVSKRGTPEQVADTQEMKEELARRDRELSLGDYARDIAKGTLAAFPPTSVLSKLIESPEGKELPIDPARFPNVDVSQEQLRKFATQGLEAPPIDPPIDIPLGLITGFGLGRKAGQTIVGAAGTGVRDAIGEVTFGASEVLRAAGRKVVKNIRKVIPQSTEVMSQIPEGVTMQPFANKATITKEGIKITKDFKYLQEMGDMKKIVGTEAYYETLAKHGYEKSNHVLNKETRDLIKRDMIKEMDRISKFGSKDKIIQQKIKFGNKTLPLSEYDFNLIKSRPNLKWNKYVQPAHRTFDDLGEPLKDALYWPVKRAEKAAKLENIDITKDINVFKKSMPKRSQERIGIFATQQQPGGMEILDAMGKKPVELNNLEMTAYEYMRGKYEDLYTRLNDARKMAGKKPFEKVENYFTWMRNVGDNVDNGFSPVFADRNILYGRPKIATFPWTKERVASDIAIDLNPFRVFEKYADKALYNIHTAKPLVKTANMINQIGTGKKAFSLAKENPKLHKFLRNWKSDISGYKFQTGITPEWFQRGLDKTSHNMTFSILGANATTIAKQPAAIVGTLTEIGIPSTLKGITQNISPAMRKMAMDKSNVLVTRAYDVTVDEAMKSVKATLSGVKSKAGKASLWPMQVVDLETARASWLGAYSKAKKLKMPEGKAIEYADSVVIRTQASAAKSDRSPLQRTSEGKFISMFNTFAIDHFYFISHDVLGIKNPKITNKEVFKKVISYIVGATSANIVYKDMLGMDSPFPSPISDFLEAEQRGEDVAGSLLESAEGIIANTIPLIGGVAKYDSNIGGAGFQVVQELFDKDTRMQAIFKLIGIPGTSQYIKYQKARKRGMEHWEAILGVYREQTKDEFDLDLEIK